MKPVRVLGTIALCIAVFVFGLYLFAPWETAGIYAMDMARLTAAKNGVFVNYSQLESRGRFFPEFQVRSLDIEGPFVKASFSDVVFRVSVVPSVLSGGAHCRILLGRGDISILPNVGMSLNSGSLRVALSDGAMKLTHMQITGDLAAAGDLTYDRANRRVSHSTVLLKVPDNVSNILNNPMLSRYLESTQPGEWRIRHHEAANQ